MTVNELIFNFRINVENGGVFIIEKSGSFLKVTKAMLDEIGEEFGGRDHSTVISSINNIEDRLKTGDLAISDIIKALTKQIGKGN